MTFSKKQLIKQMQAAATLGIITPADVAGLFSDTPSTPKKKASPSLTSDGRRRWKRGEGGRSIPANLRKAARDTTTSHELDGRRFTVVHTKREDTPYRLVLIDVETSRQIGRGIGEIVNTPAQIKSASKRILKRAEKVEQN